MLLEIIPLHPLPFFFFIMDLNCPTLYNHEEMADVLLTEKVTPSLTH